MATPTAPLPQLKLPSGPSPTTAEQRYWRSFKRPLQLPSPTGYPVTHLAAAGDLLAVTAGARVQLFSARSRKLLKTITRFNEVARCGDLRRDARVLLAGDDAGRMQVFYLASRAVLRTWADHGGLPVWVSRWAPHELTTVLSAGDDKTIRLWDLPSGEPARTFFGHQDYVRSAVFVPGTVANLVLSGSYDSTVKLWDPRLPGSAAAAMTFKHAAPVEDVLALPSGSQVLAAAGSTISVLDLVAARPLRLLANHQKTVTSLCLASRGRRLLAGGLDGHVKTFETTAWNVVNSAKYPSPVLSVLVAPATDAPDAPDRHLLVGMESGLLSIRTRFTALEAAKERDREREMAALVAGNIAALDAKTAKRKRRSAAHLDPPLPATDFVLTADRAAGTKEHPWQADLRHGRYARALDQVIDRASPEYSPVTALTLLYALRHRSAMRDALAARDERTIEPIMKWLHRHICDPRFVSVCVEASLHLLDLYAEYVSGSAEVCDLFRTLHRRVKQEVERAQVACQTSGMLDTLMVGMA